MKIKGLVFKVGNSYGLRIPKAYIKDGNIKDGKVYLVELLQEINAVNATQSRLSYFSNLF